MHPIIERLRERILHLRDPQIGVWRGELSSSALSTALALTAFQTSGAGSADLERARAAATWLLTHIHAEGGWGDTPESLPNLSTTLITHAALTSFVKAYPDNRERVMQQLVRSEAWILKRTGSLESVAVTRALAEVYGQDRTFAVPILAFLAICREEPQTWQTIPSLPFLLALLPRPFYRVLRLQVVSYALPALIAVGLCRQICAARACGRFAWGRLVAGTLVKQLARLQPAHGGFLDAIPLTAFVCLCLRQIGFSDHPVVNKGMTFIRASVRTDDSLAIDSNLGTWVTSLATRGLLKNPTGLEHSFYRGERETIVRWLLKIQMKQVHPFTGAQPGGWAWTDLPGGVPDADDTAAALIALKMLKQDGAGVDVTAAVRAGLRWLMALQNADGGMPTFCRGWGRLPFDRSCPDITAHVLHAFVQWKDQVLGMERVMQRMMRYLSQAMTEEGTWIPLWFGHQEADGGRNPIIGTARVVDALARVASARVRLPGLGEALDAGTTWLVTRQRPDGSWGCGHEATIEETALAVIALSGGGTDIAGETVERGRRWLCGQTMEQLTQPAPLGLYFSLLWYHEKMYPLVWSLEALSGTARDA